MIKDKYIINEEGQVCDVFTLQACRDLLYNYGYTIEKRNYCKKTNTYYKEWEVD